MFSKLKNLIIRNQSDNTDLNRFNTITIALEPNQEPYIYMTISNTSLEDAKALAQTLVDLNNGYYAEYMIKILMSIAEKNNQNALFISQTIRMWSEYIQSSKSVEPLIKPTEFFKKN